MSLSKDQRMQKLTVIIELLNAYQKELYEAPITNKARLKRIRLMLHEIMLELEKKV